MHCIEKSCIVGMNALVTSLLLFQMKLMERETLYLFQRWALSALLLVGRIFIELIDHKSCTTICSHLYNLLEAKFLNPNKVGIGFTSFYFWVSTVKYVNNHHIVRCFVENVLFL